MGTKRMRIGAVLTALVAMAACADGTGPNGATEVAVSFGTVAPSSGTQSLMPFGGLGLTETPVDIEGTNGVLTLEDVRVIVAEFELEKVDGTCEDLVEEDDCEKFEAGPAFVDVPLDGGSVVAVSHLVPAGSYDELEFEIEDLDDDEEDPVEAALIEELRDAILVEFPDWPRKASVLVTGTFTPTDGEPTPFRVYIEAEIEIERAMAPPLVISEMEASREITVEMDPRLWFLQGDGTVLDLTAYDYDATGLLLQFELEIENGFTEVRHDDD